MAILQLSTGAALNANINPATAREICADANVGANQGVVITPGVTGYDVVRLLNPTFDTAFQTPPPDLLGVDDIYFTPMQYPEPAGGL